MKFRGWLEIVMLVVWVLTLIIFLSQIKTNGTQCLSNPLVYGSKVLEEKNNAFFSCQCEFSNEPEFVINVNSTSWEVTNKIEQREVDKEIGGSKELNINSSNIIFIQP